MCCQVLPAQTVQSHSCPRFWCSCWCGSTPLGGCWSACLSAFSLMGSCMSCSMGLASCITVALGLTVLCVDRIGKGLMDVTYYCFSCGSALRFNRPFSFFFSGASSLSQLDWIQTTGFIVFICGSLLQHQSIVLLARLRTGKSGAVETLAHRMPTGGCFHLVSCPHYFAELLIYVSLGFVFGGRSSTWWLLVLYVFFNQALAAQLSHELYVSKYQLYPKHRKALIPFVL
ncbi:Polyprenol reductase [Oryzias melastigma]|uniref:Polyprenal reductase n=1 Tax=Oryzias melastigma TaxID=30732 RepID=A0A834CW30_ORYME|nr:Polyprenol reductase [Oryzias melastigma]